MSSHEEAGIQEDIEWIETAISEVDARCSLEEVLDAAMALDRHDWLVIRRDDDGFGDEVAQSRYYAFHPDELFSFAQSNASIVDFSLPAISVLNLNEDSASHPFDQPINPGWIPVEFDHPSQTRSIDMHRGAGATIIARVGEIDTSNWKTASVSSLFRSFVQPPPTASMSGGDEMSAGAEPPDEVASIDGAAESTSDTSTDVEVVFSAEAPGKLTVGKRGEIQVRLELKDDASPFEEAVAAKLAAKEDVTISIIGHGSAVELVGAGKQTVSPPEEGTPRTLAFGVRAIEPGTSRFEISLMQRNAVAASLGLAIKVVRRAAKAAAVAAQAIVSQVDHGDDGVLSIAVIEPSALEPNRFRYQISSRALGWTAKEYTSPAFLNGYLGFQHEVSAIYTSLEGAFAPTASDLVDSLDRLAGVGEHLAGALFTEELMKDLWTHRDAIGSIQLRSFEPYVPWELIRLQNSGRSGNQDERRFLGEYNLIRHFSGNSAPQRFDMKTWAFVIGDYKGAPNFDPVGEERSFFETTLPGKLSVPPQAVLPQKSKIKAMLKEGTTDVIHLACHGEAELGEIASANLVIGVRNKAMGVEVVKLATNDVRSSLEFSARRPIVFMNACQTGRLGLSIGKASGWPKVLWDAGAGAVVGTHWKVRSKAARLFAIAFYEALLGGDTLGTAAGKARMAARENGDVSWMAYVIYGDPAARIRRD
jgi:hypothetical protein